MISLHIITQLQTSCNMENAYAIIIGLLVVIAIAIILILVCVFQLTQRLLEKLGSLLETKVSHCKYLTLTTFNK